MTTGKGSGVMTIHQLVKFSVDTNCGCGRACLHSNAIFEDHSTFGLNL